MDYPELRVKIKNLGDEARTIRKEERGYLTAARSDAKANRPTYAENRSAYGRLRTHRIFDVRIEQRATLVAYGYLHGKAYRQIEREPHWLKAPYSRPGPDWTKVTAMIAKYQGGDKKVIFEQLKAWREAPSQQKAA